MVPETYHFHNLPPILLISHKGRNTVECEDDDVIETQTLFLYLCDMHKNIHITQSLSPKLF